MKTTVTLSLDVEIRLKLNRLAAQKNEDMSAIVQRWIKNEPEILDSISLELVKDPECELSK